LPESKHSGKGNPQKDLVRLFEDSELLELLKSGYLSLQSKVEGLQAFEIFFLLIIFLRTALP
jgi:hypothetical protein